MKLHVHDTSDAMAKAAAETAARIPRDAIAKKGQAAFIRSEEHTSELQSLS